MINNFNKDVYPQPIMNTKFPKSVNILETQRNLFKTTTAGNILLHLIGMYDIV